MGLNSVVVPKIKISKNNYKNEYKTKMHQKTNGIDKILSFFVSMENYRYLDKESVFLIGIPFFKLKFHFSLIQTRKCVPFHRNCCQNFLGETVRFKRITVIFV